MFVFGIAGWQPRFPSHYHAAQAAWSPKKPVEFIIMAGTGGGADQIARLLQGLIEKKGLSPRPFIPINKPGGSGGEALRYLKDKAGDDHIVMVTLNSFYTQSLLNDRRGVEAVQGHQDNVIVARLVLEIT